MTPLLEVRELSVQRGGVTVLEISSFSVLPEEKVGIIGPNGSGKSTLLLSLAHLIPFRKGTVLFRGEPVERSGELAFRRRIAMVFQEPLLFDTTVIQNVAEGLRIRGEKRSRALERAEESLALFNILHLKDRSAHKLSGGEAQRVSLARAFATRPDLIILDEPFSSLDLPTRITIAEELGEILHRSKTAAVIATHDRIEALRIVERLAVIDGGRIVQQGRPDEVIASPANDFVRAFRRTGYSQLPRDGETT